MIMKINCGTIFLLLLWIMSSIGKTQAQQMSVKSNLLYDATTTINLGLEAGFTPHWSLEISGNYNPWTFSDNRKLKHWLVSPEVRYWNCELYNRGFWGFHLLGGQYNAGNIKLPFGLLPTLKDTRYQGWMVGAGVSYGYHLYLGAHWNLEAAIGLGYIYMRYDKFECFRCGRATGQNMGRHYWGPTRIGLSIVYLFNHK